MAGNDTARGRRRQAPRRPRLLFVPVTAPSGSGEYYRSRALALTFLAQYPGSEIAFVLNRHAGIRAEPEFVTFETDGSPTRNTPGVTRIIDQWQPDAVVFDGAARLRQLRHARQQGAKTVFVSSRPKKRRLGFRYRAMAWMDEHWIVQSGLEPRLSLRERFKLGDPPRVQVRFFNTLFPVPAEVDVQQVRQQTGLLPEQPFLLFVSGGGGQKQRGQLVADVFAEAATVAARQTGLPVVVVAGPRYPGKPLQRQGIIYLRVLPQRQMMALLSEARVAVVGAGTLVMQALALGRPCVTACTGGSDQPARFRLLQRRQLALTVPTRADRLADAAVRLHRDQALRDKIMASIRDTGVRNDLDNAVNALAGLLLP